MTSFDLQANNAADTDNFTPLDWNFSSFKADIHKQTSLIKSNEDETWEKGDF